MEKAGSERVEAAVGGGGDRASDERGGLLDALPRLGGSAFPSLSVQEDNRDVGPTKDL